MKVQESSPDGQEIIPVARDSNEDEAGEPPATGFWARASQLAEALTTHGDFEAFIMVIIAGTVVTLALGDPLQGDMEGINGKLYWLSEWECGSMGHKHGAASGSIRKSENTLYLFWCFLGGITWQ